MNDLMDHTWGDDGLSRLGARLRAEATDHHGDLGELAARSRRARQRARLAVVGGTSVVVVALVLVGIARSGSGTDSLQVGGDGTRPGGGTSATELPMGTVNPSIPADPAQGEIWGVDITYDPTSWDYARLIALPALDPIARLGTDGFPIGSASYHREPRMQAYWQGPRARQVAEDVRDQLLALPGIVSVEVGPAAPTSRLPDTTGVVPVVPPGPSTTLAPFVRRDGSELGLSQDEALADGIVTDDEYDLMFWTWVTCSERLGADVSVFGRQADGRYVSTIGSGVAGADACYQQHFVQVDMAWQLAHDGGTPSSAPGG